MASFRVYGELALDYSHYLIEALRIIIKEPARARPMIHTLTLASRFTVCSIL